MAAPATRPAALRARIRRCRLAHLCSRPATLAGEGRSRMRRCIGLDVHREFAQVAIWEDGVVWQAGRIQTTPEALRDFADSLCATDEVALEATGNTHAIARLLERHVGRVVVSNPQKTRAIAEAKVKTDKVDAAVLAGLLAADYLPSVWLPDDQTHALRRQVTRRAHIVRQRTRLKNQVQSILHRNLVPRCPAADLFGNKGRAWLATQDLPADEHQAVGALLRQLDFHGQELRIVDAELGRVGLERAEVRRLMTIPGVDATVAMAIVAAVGDFGRFSSPQRLVSYLGLNPRVRQSGGQPAQHGRITKQGRAHARGMLVEAAWAAAKTPGRCVPFTSVSAPDAACRSPWWPPPASSPPCAGTWSLVTRTTPSSGPRTPTRSSGRWSCAPASHPGGGARAQRPPIPSRRSAGASGRSPSRPKPPTASSSPAGNPSGQRPSPDDKLRAKIGRAHV